MNETNPSATNPPLPRRSKLNVIGVGGVGGKITARLAGNWPYGRLVAIDSDSAALQNLSGVETHQLGVETLRGLGAGGDPEHAAEIAGSEREALMSLCCGAEVTLVVAGLGRGVGSGVAPLIAEMTRASGSLVIGFAVQPFPMEGRRCCEQAEAALASFQMHADGVVGLANGRMASLVGAQASLVSTFDASNRQLGDGLRAVARLLQGGGLMDVDFAQLAGVLRDKHAGSVFATEEVSGEGRAAAAVKKLLSHPLLDGGAVLDDAGAVLVGITGGPELGLAEVSEIMEQINTRTGTAPVVLGAAVDDSFAGKISLTLIVSRAAEVEPAPLPSRFVPPVATVPKPPAATPPASVEPDLGLGDSPAGKTPASRSRSRSNAASSPSAESADDKTAKPPGKGAAATRRSRAAAAKLKQEQLPFDTVSKGRFDKSEPTIYQGEDLDLPTFVRRGVVLN